MGLALAGTYAKHTYDFNRSVEQGETIVAGRDVDTAPRHINTARAEWRPIESLATELEWIGVGSYFVDAANAHDYAGHDLLNLRISWQATDNWTGVVRVNNLTDRAYADRALCVRQLPLLPRARPYGIRRSQLSRGSLKKRTAGGGRSELGT